MPRSDPVKNNHLPAALKISDAGFPRLEPDTYHDARMYDHGALVVGGSLFVVGCFTLEAPA